MLSLEMLEPHIVMSDSLDSDASLSIVRDHQLEGSLEASRTTRSKNTAYRHVTFQDTKTQQQTIIHSISRQRLRFDKASNIDTLDDRIARHEETTSSYEELPHRLRISKKH